MRHLIFIFSGEGLERLSSVHREGSQYILPRNPTFYHFDIAVSGNQYNLSTGINVLQSVNLRILNNENTFRIANIILINSLLTYSSYLRIFRIKVWAILRYYQSVESNIYGKCHRSSIQYSADWNMRRLYNRFWLSISGSKFNLTFRLLRRVSLRYKCTGNLVVGQNAWQSIRYRVIVIDPFDNHTSSSCMIAHYKSASCALPEFRKTAVIYFRCMMPLFISIPTTQTRPRKIKSFSRQLQKVTGFQSSILRDCGMRQ